MMLFVTITPVSFIFGKVHLPPPSYNAHEHNSFSIVEHIKIEEYLKCMQKLWLSSAPSSEAVKNLYENPHLIEWDILICNPAVEVMSIVSFEGVEYNYKKLSLNPSQWAMDLLKKAKYD